MKKFTEREYEVLYELGIMVHENKLSKNYAAEKMANELKFANGDPIEKNTASMYIQFLADLLTPKVIKRTMGIDNARYYANRILKDYGEEKLKTFLEGLELHIEYRQSKGIGVPGFCSLHNEFSKKIGLTPKF